MKCEKAKIYCQKHQYREAGWIECFKLKMHLTFCEKCRNFSKRNKKLGFLIQKADLQSLTEAETIRLKESINTKLKKF